MTKFCLHNLFFFFFTFLKMVRHLGQQPKEKREKNIASVHYIVDGNEDE